MRRGRRLKREGGIGSKYLLYISAGILLTLLITFMATYFIYNKKLKEISYSSLTSEKIADLVPNMNENMPKTTEQASSEIGKTIEEAINELETQDNETNTVNKNENIQEEQTVITNESKTEQKVVEEKEPDFAYPIETGETVRGFFKDNLVFSETLQEWITHTGIDIKAERTTVVKAAEAGEVISIKNDPRYGLTIILKHTKGFTTVYSNLLTTEFVTEGEKVEKGQSLGTVGNSAVFEIADEPHLHFEIIKDNISVDPNLYLK